MLSRLNGREISSCRRRKMQISFVPSAYSLLREVQRWTQIKIQTKPRPSKEIKNPRNALVVLEIQSNNPPSKLASALHLMSISTNPKIVAPQNINTPQEVSMATIITIMTSFKFISVLNRRCESRKARSLLSTTSITKHRPYMEVDRALAITAKSQVCVWEFQADEIAGHYRPTSHLRRTSMVNLRLQNS